MAKSTAKLYLFYLLVKSESHCHSAKEIRERTGLSRTTIIKARKELEELGLVSTKKEMIPGYKNKKPRIKVKLLHAPAIEKINAPRRAALKKFRFYG